MLTQRGEVVCLDVAGLANGNQGPFPDEARYKAGDEGKLLGRTDGAADAGGRGWWARGDR